MSLNTIKAEPSQKIQTLSDFLPLTPLPLPFLVK